jgi:predicted O-linked N-acetylglucosamine transferase (SPINDLY family)
VTVDIVVAARVDILLYIALPTEKMTFLMAQHRLAPIQLAFGGSMLFLFL